MNLKYLSFPCSVLAPTIVKKVKISLYFNAGMFLRQGLDYGKKVKLVVNKMRLYNITGIDITMSRGKRETYLEKDHRARQKQGWVNEKARSGMQQP